MVSVYSPTRFTYDNALRCNCICNGIFYSIFYSIIVSLYG